MFDICDYIFMFGIFSKIIDTKKRLIVIHGWGGSYADAANRIGELLYFDCYWQKGTFMVPRRIATMIRHLLNVPDPDHYTKVLQKLTISRFISSKSATKEINTNQDYTGFSENRLRQDFAHIGMPISPSARSKRSAQINEQAQKDLSPIMEVINTLQETWSSTNGHNQTEKESRKLIETLSKEAGLTNSLLPLLEMLREMHESGGDLDTVGSAAFYAHWMITEARKKNRELVYGKDYEFIFVNYHESMLHMEKYAPAELYVADLPIGAFPHLEEEIPYLNERGVHIARFEDHHPYPAERRANLEKLVKEGTLGFLALSGPLLNQEIPKDEEPQCGADMVYNNLIAGTIADTAGVKQLRQATHGEDFVTNRTDFGILLTNLIKGGICKIELAQLLVDSMQNNDALQRLEKRDWAQLPAIWHKDIEKVAETLTENVVYITLAATKTKIVCALAAHADPGKPRLTTGKAVEFFARNYTDADYIFYCFGSSIMVARRLNHSDTQINLGSLMPFIGTESDGGHSGAAVCRPDANPHYPAQILGRINKSNFTQFVRYLATRLDANNYETSAIEDVSTGIPNRWQNSKRKVGIVLLAALLAGLLLTAMFPSFRRKSVQESNKTHFTQFIIAEDPSPAQKHPRSSAKSAVKKAEPKHAPKPAQKKMILPEDDSAVPAPRPAPKQPSKAETIETSATTPPTIETTETSSP